MTDPGGAVILVTGVQAAGKSTVAALLAARFDRGAHVQGDVFLRMIRTGGVAMGPGGGEAAEAQLRLRHRQSAVVADSFAAAGFTAVAEDNAYGETWLDDWVAAVRARPVYVVVLLPDPEVVEAREAGRDKAAYRPAGHTVADLDDALRNDTSRLGLWVDNSAQTPEQTVDEILVRLDEALVSGGGAGDVPAAAEWVATNQRWWDERVAMHEASPFYDLDGFVAHPDRIRPFEVEDLGDVTGKSLVHLQCHLGTDTISWATRGATVVGLDFSVPAVEAARRLAARLGYDDGRAEFVAADVYDAPAALGGRTFDVVYTGLGAISWLPDLERWAEVACSLVAPGGVLYLAEFHPFVWVFSDGELDVAVDYWDPGTAYPSPWTYAGDGVLFDSDVEVLRNTPVADVVNAVVANGLVVEHLGEHPFTYFKRWPFLLRDETTGRYEMPPDRPRLPLILTLRARRPASAAPAPPS
ncbi:MAG: methyltransferase domain-containing protein [Acidimicrobiia bacterium]|nr:methyltransferase domain-containing protein [Acidimicrobiia bacterium]